MSKQITSQAETVDAKGAVHATVGDNIRSYNNAPEQAKVDLKAILDAIYPIGSLFIGVMPREWLNVTTWQEVTGTTKLGNIFFDLGLPQQAWSQLVYKTATSKIGETAQSITYLSLPILKRIK